MSQRSNRRYVSRSQPFQFSAFEHDRELARKILLKTLSGFTKKLDVLAKTRKDIIKQWKTALRIDAQLEVQVKSLREYYKEEITISKCGPDIVKLFSLINIDCYPRALCESTAVVQRLEEWRSEVASTEWYTNYTKLKTKERKLMNQLRATEGHLDELKRLLQAYKAIGKLAPSLKDRSPEIANRMIQLAISRELPSSCLQSSQEADNDESEEEI